MGGVYVYDSITIPAGVTVSASLPLTLHARQSLVVDGSIVDTPTITLVSDLVASVRGVVRAADGTTELPAGGDIHLIATQLDVEGTLQSGNGAPGLDATQDVQDTQSTVAVAGTPGGKGGDIVMGGTSVWFSGQFVIGNGGRGGHATALGGTLAATATGGEGGPSGQLVLPPGYDPITMHNLGHLQGGEGGNGGDATAITFIGLPLFDGVAGEGVTNDKGTLRACDGPRTTAPPGARGVRGCEGAAASATGGEGGYGLIRGGEGGKAHAEGGKGGKGGRGADGTLSDCDYLSSFFVPCQPYYGGQGGYGGIGGAAEAAGGKGGDALIQGGEGGDAYARGGEGGNGGNGGDAGGGWVRGWRGDSLQSTARQFGCLATIFGSTSSWTEISCYLSLEAWDSRLVCGHEGYGGPGSTGRVGSATPGRGGKAVQGLLLEAAPGTPAASNGNDGWAGFSGVRREILAFHEGSLLVGCSGTRWINPIE